MEASDVLLNIASASVAFAGFAGVVIAIGRHAAGQWRPSDVIRFWQMIEVSMLGLLFSFLPFVFHYLGLPKTTVWAASSAMLALASGLQMLRAVYRTVRFFRSDESMSLVFTGTFVLVETVVLAVLVAKAVGFHFQQAVGPYLVGMFWQLCLASVLFWRLLKFSGLPYHPPQRPEVASQESAAKKQSECPQTASKA